MAYRDLVLKYTLNDVEHTIYLGHVVSFTETFSKSVSVFPLVSMSQDDAFALENGNGQSFDIRFKHIADDSTEAYDGCTPAQWYENLTSFIDRWQARSNGFTLVYMPSPQVRGGNNFFANPYVQNLNINGYVKSLQRTYNAGNLLEIDCTMRFDVGTMYVRNKYLVPIGWTSQG